MAAALADRFRRWFAYERDVHERVFASLESVPLEKRDCPEFRKAVELMGHLIAARIVWLNRLGGGPALSTPLFPLNARLEDVRADSECVQLDWSTYLEAIGDATLARNVEYHTLTGAAWRNTVEEILTQLFGHSFYHRGQIALLVRAAGGVPAETDYIHWIRANPS